MKYLGAKDSRRGHHKKDYIFSMSELEFTALKKLLAKIPANLFEKHDQKEVVKNALNSLRKTIFNISPKEDVK